MLGSPVVSDRLERGFPHKRTERVGGVVDKLEVCPRCGTVLVPTTPKGATMGMDVYGKEPTSEKGEYFRNNVWWWRPLWNYCCEIADAVIGESLAEDGHYNGGAGLDGVRALALAEILREELESGRTAEYERKHNEYRASLPREDCDFCGATGIRTDDVGVNMGQPNRELSPEVQILTGRTHGWCNACDGIGTRESFGTGYPFSVENVREFVEFLTDSGGFSIY